MLIGSCGNDSDITLGMSDLASCEARDSVGVDTDITGNCAESFSDDVGNFRRSSDMLSSALKEGALASWNEGDSAWCVGPFT